MLYFFVRKCLVWLSFGKNRDAPVKLSPFLGESFPDFCFGSISALCKGGGTASSSISVPNPEAEKSLIPSNSINAETPYGN